MKTIPIGRARFFHVFHAPFVPSDTTQVQARQMLQFSFVIHTDKYCNKEDLYSDNRNTSIVHIFLHILRS